MECNKEEEIKQKVINALKGISEIIIMDEAGKETILKTENHGEDLEIEIQCVMLDLKEDEWIDEVYEW
jgi:hypothetical protein